MILPERRSRHAARRELLVGLVLLLVAGGGAAISLGPGTAAEEGRLEGGAIYSERAAFCPALPDGAVGVSDLAAGSRSGSEMGVMVEPLDGRAEEVPEDTIVLRRVDAAYPHDVVGFGDLLGASTYTEFQEPISGVAAAACSARASGEWLFPQGSSADGFNQRLVVYNPFPGDAVVRITFFTPGGPRTRAALSDVAVPSGRATTITVNRFILQQPVLATQVSAVRGRVAAWKYLFVRPPGPTRGASFTSGAPEPATQWYFPVGRVHRDTRQTISLVNPTEEEAVVTISLVTEGEPLQPADLVEMSLPRMTARAIPLRRALEGERPGDVSAIVTSVNDVPIAAERSMVYESGRRRGFATQIGSSTAGGGWWVGPATARADEERLTLLNVSDDEVTARLRIAGPEGPGDWEREISLPAGGRGSVRIPRAWTTGAVIVEADGPVVAERFARTGDDITLLLGARAPGR